MFAAWSCSGVGTDCRTGLCQGKGGVYLAGGPDVREEDVPLVARREGEARLELRLDLFPAQREERPFTHRGFCSCAATRSTVGSPPAERADSQHSRTAARTSIAPALGQET